MSCFYLLVLMRNAAMNMALQILLQDIPFNYFAIYPKVKLLDYVVILFLSFEELHFAFYGVCINSEWRTLLVLVFFTRLVDFNHVIWHYRNHYKINVFPNDVQKPLTWECFCFNWLLKEQRVLSNFSKCLLKKDIKS